jgi:hypothetical protein
MKPLPPSPAQGPLCDAFLDQMRTEADPLADEALAEVFEHGGRGSGGSQQVDRINALLRDITHNDEPLPSELPPLLRRYFEETAELPAWADLERIERGNDLLGRYVPQILIALYCGSLPSCYAARKGVQVLYLSKRMHQTTYRRILETAQFILDVLDEGGLGPRGFGRRSAQKVRLLHGAIRYHLRRHAQWDPEWDLPINQEDLTGTLLSFSVAVPEGLMRLGIDLTEDERDSYFHTFRVVGHLLGVDPRLNVERYEDGLALARRIAERHHASSMAGRVLMADLLAVLAEVLPGTLVDGMPATLVRHISGDRVADLLGVPEADWTRGLVEPLKWLGFLSDGLGDRSALIAHLMSRLGGRLLGGVFRLLRGEGRFEWRIPRSVAEKWGDQWGDKWGDLS